MKKSQKYILMTAQSAIMTLTTDAVILIEDYIEITHDSFFKVEKRIVKDESTIMLKGVLMKNEKTPK